MKTIHFVYALPRLDNLFYAILQKVGRTYFYNHIKHGQIDEYKWSMPLRAPQSITYNIADFLSKNYKLKLYDLRERIKIQPSKGDILLGHIWPDRKSVMWDALKNTNFEKRYLITPYNNDSSQVEWVKEALERCDNYFGICGDYWVENLTTSCLKGIEKKFIHLNMAIDVMDYPRVKNEFNPIGSRRFFYIGRHGRFGDEKGISLLEELAERIPGFDGGYICGGREIKGWYKISEPGNLTPKFMQQLAEHYDVFINMSRADAQATTIIEAMSWGFPVACTKQSGYSREKELFYLSLENMEWNIETIEKIQSLPDGELRRIATVNRAVVETKYNWGCFLSRIENFFRRMM